MKKSLVSIPTFVFVCVCFWVFFLVGDVCFKVLSL